MDGRSKLSNCSFLMCSAFYATTGDASLPPFEVMMKPTLDRQRINSCFENGLPMTAENRVPSSVMASSYAVAAMTVGVSLMRQPEHPKTYWESFDSGLSSTESYGPPARH